MKIPHPMQNLLNKIKRWRLLILIVLIFCSVIAAGYSMQTGYANQQTQNRPILIFNPITQSDNYPKATVAFYIENIGVNPAYHVHSQVCWAPESNLENLSDKEIIGVNPLYPHNQRILLVELIQNDSDIWYIYYLLKYSDAVDKGKEYTEEYWCEFDFNTGNLLELTPTQKQTFQPYIDEFLAN